jgi:hypothetical protein
MQQKQSPMVERYVVNKLLEAGKNAIPEA